MHPSHVLFLIGSKSFPFDVIGLRLQAHRYVVNFNMKKYSDAKQNIVYLKREFLLLGY